MRSRILAVFIMLTSMSMLAQSEQYKGYYITRDLDTIYGEFNVPGTGVGELPNLGYMQNRVMFTDKDKIRYEVTPTKVLEVVFEAKNTEYRLVAVKNTIGLETDIMNKSSYMFFRILQDGHVKLYQYFHKNNSTKHQSMSSSIYFTDVNNKNYRYCIRLGEKGELIRVRKYRFRKIMKEMFADYEDLATSVQNKEYGKDDIEIIVNDYNKWHKEYYHEK